MGALERVRLDGASDRSDDAKDEDEELCPRPVPGPGGGCKALSAATTR